MKKGYLLDNKDGCHYSFGVTDSRGVLFYSKIGNWTSSFKGKAALTLHDDGNNYHLTWKNPLTKEEKKVTLDVCQIAELLQLGQLFFKHKKGQLTKYITVKHD